MAMGPRRRKGGIDNPDFWGKSDPSTQYSPTVYGINPYQPDTTLMNVERERLRGGIAGSEARQAESRGIVGEAVGGYRDVIAGTAPSVAEEQLRQATEKNVQNQMGLAAQGRGGNIGATSRAAAGIGAGNAMELNQQAAMLRAGEVAGARQGLAGVGLGLSQQDLAERGMYEQGLSTLAGQQIGADVALRTAGMNYQLGLQDLNFRKKQDRWQRRLGWAQFGANLYGDTAQAISSIFGGM